MAQEPEAGGRPEGRTGPGGDPNGIGAFTGSARSLCVLFWLWERGQFGMITDTLAEPVRKRIAKRLQSLHKNPRPQGAKKLASEDGLYRIREGDHRIIYTIRNKEPIVLVVKIGDWKEVYRSPTNRMRQEPFPGA